jgi:hypothetical protein
METTPPSPSSPERAAQRFSGSIQKMWVQVWREGSAATGTWGQDADQSRAAVAVTEGAKVNGSTAERRACV